MVSVHWYICLCIKLKLTAWEHWLEVSRESRGLFKGTFVWHEAVSWRFNPIWKDGSPEMSVDDNSVLLHNEKLQCRSGGEVWEQTDAGIWQRVDSSGRVWGNAGHDTLEKKKQKNNGEWKGSGRWGKRVGTQGEGQTTAVHLSCERVTVPMNPRGVKEEVVSAVSKTRVWTDTRVFNRSYSDGLNRVEWGGRTRGGSAGTALVLVYWFWLPSVGQSGLRGSTGRGWGCLVMRGWGGRTGLCKVFVLTAVMHGVAGDNHRWGHGDGSTPHGELVGDGIVSTAAAGAWLARSGSWKKE